MDQTDLALFTENRADDNDWKEKKCKRTNGTNEEFALSSFLPLSIHSSICLSKIHSTRKGRKGRERERRAGRVQKGKERGSEGAQGRDPQFLYSLITQLWGKCCLCTVQCASCVIFLCLCHCHVCVGLYLSMSQRVATMEKRFLTMNQPLFQNKKSIVGSLLLSWMVLKVLRLPQTTSNNRNTASIQSSTVPINNKAWHPCSTHCTLEYTCSLIPVGCGKAEQMMLIKWLGFPTRFLGQPIPFLFTQLYL